jgi:hypothetical protein
MLMPIPMPNPVIDRQMPNKMNEGMNLVTIINTYKFELR